MTYKGHITGHPFKDYLSTGHHCTYVVNLKSRYMSVQINL